MTRMGFAVANKELDHAKWQVSVYEEGVKHMREALELQRIQSEAQRAAHRSMLEQAQHALAVKNSAMEAGAEQHAAEMLAQSAEAETQMQSLAAEHVRHIEELQAQSTAAALETQIHAEAQMEELEDQLAALKQRFEARQAVLTCLGRELLMMVIVCDNSTLKSYGNE